MKDYEKPSWASLPKDLYSLEILKDGSMINEIPLHNKDHYVLGRQPDVCDIGLDHPSISRVHAILQFHENGNLMIIDMGSAHGTFINKQEIKKDEFHQLKVGDFLKFGASTRSYIVKGPENLRPEEYDSENMRTYRKKLLEKSTELQTKKQNEETNGIGWGFREDAVNYDEDDLNNHIQDEENIPDYIKKDPNYERKFGEKFTSSIVDSKVSEKDSKLLEKLRKKEKKIQNMQQEISRIYMKENSQDSGLTPGQIAAVERNDRRIEELREQVESIERTLNEKANQREESKGGGGVVKAVELKKKKVVERDSDDDDQLDTTRETADVSTNWRLKKKQNLQSNSSQLTSLLSSSSSQSSSAAVSAAATSVVAVSYEQLCQEKEKKQARYNAIMKEIQHHEEVLKKSKSSESSEIELEMDELERYLLTSQAEESQKLKQELHQEAQQIILKMIELEKYIQISAPALSSLSTKAIASTTTSSSNQKEQHAKPQTIPVPEVQSNPSEPVTASPAASQSEVSEVVASQDTSKPLHSSSTTASLKRNIRHSTMAIANSSIPWDTTDKVAEESQQTKRAKHEAEESEVKRKAKKSIGPSMPNQRPSQPLYSGDQLEGGDPVWIPPKNQSGDGKTALNAKYGY
jgi:hypothetical protein